MHARPTAAEIAWACEVLGVRVPALRGDGHAEDRRTWSTWKARAVEPASRFVPGRTDVEVHVARDLLLQSPVPGSGAGVRPMGRPLDPSARAHLAVQFGRFGFE